MSGILTPNLHFFYIPVHTGFLKNNNERGKTNFSSIPTLESTSSRRRAEPSGETTNAQTAKPTESKNSKPSKFKTTYTVWGGESCRDDVKKVYSGKFQISQCRVKLVGRFPTKPLFASQNELRLMQKENDSIVRIIMFSI